MPKMKSHSSTAKRFELTKSGNLTHKKAGQRHKLTCKSTKRKRNLRKAGTLTATETRNICAMIPYK